MKNYPFLPFLIFAGALITTATIGLPVFTSWFNSISISGNLMVSILNNELIGSPNKTLIKVNLFDFIKKRENMNLCGSEKSVSRPFLKVVNF